MGKRKTAAREDDSVVIDDDDEYSIGTEPLAGDRPVNDEEDCSMIKFSGKKKPSKKKNNTTIQASKNKKNGTQEEDDIDKILAQLAVVEPPQELEEKVQTQVEPATVAAAKKKKKKKEKEKQKKAAGVESKDKKVPKYVREILERLARLKEAQEKKKREEEEKLRKEHEERLRQEELERTAQERKRLKKEKEKEKVLKKKQQGKLLTAKQKAEAQRLELMRNQILEKGGALLQVTRETPSKRPVYITKKSKPHHQEDNNVSDEIAEAHAVEDDDWETKRWDDADLKLPVVEKEIKSTSSSKENQPVANKGEQQAVNGENEEEEGEKTLRSPICCVMGHVDAGKTKFLDCIRRTNVQEGEAGGITQQIGATYISAKNIRERAKELKADAKLNVPGLVVIDTPGHEAFKNLRSRGSGLCDIAILVVDIMHGLEQQTIESIELLRTRNTQFIVALNKVDRLYGWKTCHNAPIGKAMKQQSKDVITEFMEQGLNTELYYKNKDWGETYSIVPTSAISGEGIPEMLLLLIQWAQKTMVKELTYSSEVQCKVLEVKVIKGCGTTIDVVLYNGLLHVGDEIVVCGFKASVNTRLIL
ncbi:hypothetical protein L1987_00376 [Smallanthus sonchifolius]|uniref:Uncharacterized protein n=1 Tax=Smallanthus sonchifolius TaxID=185202 RepID=A0ACB9K239_9ASTR|nr:hypothetical protein L1987_00376 [Smallanthus sonchifolius]